MLFVRKEPLHTRNSIVVVDMQAPMPHALTPALPSGNKRVGIYGVIFVLVALMVLLVDKEMEVEEKRRYDAYICNRLVGRAAD